MAIAVVTKEDVTLLWGEQATFGTVLADTADFNGTTPEWGEILDAEIVPLDWDTRVREPNRSHVGQRVTLASNFQQDQKGVVPKFAVTGDAKKATLASFLYAVIQNVSEAAGTPFEKTYTFGNTQPDFTADGGWFGTLIIKQGSSQSQKIRDMICSELTLTCDPDNGQGRMQMVANIIGRGAPLPTSNPNTGVLAKYAQTFYHFHDLKTCTVGGSAVVPLSITINIKNNAVPVGVNLVTAGDFLTYAIPKYEVNVTLKAHWDSISYALQYGHTTASTPTPIILTWGTDNADGYLNWTIYGTQIASPDNYDPVKALELNFKATYDGTNAPLTVVLADLIDRAW
jgi:hypothetical protein